MSRLLSVGDCRVGMKVRHIMTTGRSRGMGDGEITAIGPDGVLVVFENSTCGLYDDKWFRHTQVWLEVRIQEDELDAEWAE